MLLTSIALVLALSLLVVLAGRGVFFAVPPGADAAAGPTRFLVTLLRLALFVAIAASAALVVEYRSAGDPTFCGPASGCYAVRASPYSHPFGVPLPNLGAAAYTALLAASFLLRERWHHVAFAAIAVAGGLAAAILLGLQAFTIGAFCAWCLAVDVAAIAAAVLAAMIAWRAVRGPREPFERATQSSVSVATAWAAASAAAIGLPFLWGQHPVLPPLPPEIAAMQAPGKLTVVVFTDFECPFCRKLHPELEKLEAAHGDALHVVRKMVPLPFHRGALPAAKAYVCAPEEKREQAAALLYSAPSSKLNEDVLPSLLAPLDLPSGELAACLSAPATEAAIGADVATYTRLGVRGLPLTYVGRRLVLGYNPELLRAAVRRELAGERLSLPLPWLLVALFGVAAVAVAVSRRDRPRGAVPGSASEGAGP